MSASPPHLAGPATRSAVALGEGLLCFLSASWAALSLLGRAFEPCSTSTCRPETEKMPESQEEGGVLCGLRRVSTCPMYHQVNVGLGLPRCGAA